MSTDAFPFGPADEAPVETAPEQPSAGGGRRRLAVLGLAGVLVAAAGFVLLDPLGGSGDDQVAAPAQAVPADPAVDPVTTDPSTDVVDPLAPDVETVDLVDPTVGDVVAEGDLVPSTFADVTGRNPFDLPAYLAVGSGSGADGASTPGVVGVDFGAGQLPELPVTDDPADPGTPDDQPGTAQPLTSAPGSSQPGATVDDDGRRVALVDVFVDPAGETKVQTRVDGTVHTTAVGEVFATTLQVVSVDGACAQYLNGDERFTLCEGQEVLK